MMGKKIKLINPKKAYLNKSGLTQGDITGLLSGRIARIVSNNCFLELQGDGRDMVFACVGPVDTYTKPVTGTDLHRLQQTWAICLYHAALHELKGPQP